MRIHRYGYGIRGFGHLSNYGLCFMVMVSEKAQYRYEVNFITVPPSKDRDCTRNRLRYYRYEGS